MGAEATVAICSRVDIPRYSCHSSSLGRGVYPLRGSRCGVGSCRSYGIYTTATDAGWLRQAVGAADKRAGHQHTAAIRELGEAGKTQRGNGQNATPPVCFYCKKPGHYQRVCQQRIRDIATSGPSNTTFSPAPTAMSSAVGMTYTGSYDTRQMKRAIGPQPVITVLMGGVPVECLVDSGSQVSMVEQRFFDKHLRTPYARGTDRC